MEQARDVKCYIGFNSVPQEHVKIYSNSVNSVATCLGSGPEPTAAKLKTRLGS